MSNDSFVDFFIACDYRLKIRFLVWIELIVSGALVMTVKHVNRKGRTYYLHESKTKSGKPKYFFSMKDVGVLVESIPEGFEVYENPDAQVFLRKPLPRFITDAEVTIVRHGLRRYAKDQHWIVDVREKHIVIYDSEQGDLYQKCFGSPSLMR